jgi:hypothetical protein
MVAGGRLSDRLRDAIAKSEYLIVVCSPAAAARGAWVDTEIREFLAVHDADHILAVVIAGEPNAVRNGQDAAEECMPPSLLSLFEDPAAQPLWVDMRAGKSDRSAFLRIVAALLSIDSLDALVRRDALRAGRRRKIVLGAIAAGCIVLALLGGAFLSQRSAARAEAANVALTRARNALLAGRSREGYQILREAYASGAGGEVETALISMAGWLPDSGDVRPAANNPLIVRRGNTISIVHASGARTAIGGNPERILLSRDFRRAIVYSNGRLEVFSLTDGRKVASRELGLALRPRAPVLGAASGTMLLGFINEAGVIREQRSYLVTVNAAGQISEPMDTHVSELDGRRDEENFLHLGQVPLMQVECSHIGLLRPEAAAQRWRGDTYAMPATLNDFVFYEIAAGGLRRITGAPALSRPGQVGLVNGYVPDSVLGYQVSRPPVPPEGVATGTNLDSLSTYGCPTAPGRDLAQAALRDSVIDLGANADREPQGWWGTDPAPAPGGSYAFEMPVANPCAQRQCAFVGRSLSDEEATLPFHNWYPGPLPRGAKRQNTPFLLGSQTGGQFGHSVVICRVPGAGGRACASFAGSDAGGPGFAGAAISPDESLVFVAGTEEGNPGFSLLRLAAGIEIKSWRRDGPWLAGNLADFTEDSRLLVTLDREGNIATYRIGERAVEQVSATTSSFVPQFEAPDDLDDARTANMPVPIALRHAGGESVLIARRDGGLALISRQTGIEIWQSRIRGIGTLTSVVLSPDRETAMVIGRSGARLLSTSTGIPVSGVFAYPENAVYDSAVSNAPIWVENSGAARIANVWRRARSRPASIEDAVSRLDAYFSS